MINFVVTIACIAHMQCPLTSPIVTSFTANSAKECQGIFKNLAAQYGVPSANFTVTCQPKR
jgi:hypothetical protein